MKPYPSIACWILSVTALCIYLPTRVQAGDSTCQQQMEESAYADDAELSGFPKVMTMDVRNGPLRRHKVTVSTAFSGQTHFFDESRSQALSSQQFFPSWIRKIIAPTNSVYLAEEGSNRRIHLRYDAKTNSVKLTRFEAIDFDQVEVSDRSMRDFIRTFRDELIHLTETNQLTLSRILDGQALLATGFTDLDDPNDNGIEQIYILQYQPSQNWDHQHSRFFSVNSGKEMSLSELSKFAEISTDRVHYVVEQDDQDSKSYNISIF